MITPELAAQLHSLRTMVVRTAAIESFEAQFGRLVARRRAEIKAGNSVEARGIAVIGNAGCGKTFSVQHVISRFQAKGLLKDNEVCSFIIPSPATLKLVGWKLLDALGYSVQSPRITSGVLWQRVRDHLERNEALFLIIDEAHDLLGRASAKERHDVINTLKSLMQQRGWPISLILIGVSTFNNEPGLGDLLRHDPQLARRLSVIEYEPLNTVAHEDIIADLLSNYAKRADVTIAKGGLSGDLVKRLLHASGYQFGVCIMLIVDAIEIACWQKSQLSVADFGVAFSNWSGVDEASNPFYAHQYLDCGNIAAHQNSKLGRR